MTKSKAPSQRQLRVGELVRHALTTVLSRETLPDPILENQLISISEVRMSPDLKIATCFVSLLGNVGADNGKNKPKNNTIQTVIKALAKNEKFIRGRASPLLNQMKYMPTFRFLEDTSFDNFSRIDALLRSDAVQQDINKEE